MHNRQARKRLVSNTMKKILIVDDNLEFLRLLSSLLEQDQLLIYKAAGVQEAIELLENTTVDAICSDYGMRDGTGLELFQKLRLRDVKIPFMIMSADDDYQLINKIKSWGASFCSKTSHELIGKIKAL